MTRLTEPGDVRFVLLYSFMSVPAYLRLRHIESDQPDDDKYLQCRSVRVDANLPSYKCTTYTTNRAHSAVPTA